MLTDWTYWLSSIPQASLWLLLSALLLFDAPRYLIGSMLVWYIDAWTSINPFRQRTVGTDGFTYCPSICVIVAGLNEARSLRRGLSAIWGTYPRLEIIVVDDGSNDGMSQVAHDFARNHADVRVVTKRRRGGKSSAMNAALPLTDAEVVVVLDADSELSPHALWEIVQPLADPRVAAVSGNVRVRNTHANVLTRVQCFEYLRSILLGRIVSSRLGLLGIVSGAFGAFRRTTLCRVGGWDVGPGEDEDIVLRLRKLGFGIEFAPYADCLTDVPETWKGLIKQRRRWEWAVVTFESRKHIDMANPFSKHFRWSNFLLFVERWIFNLILPMWFWAYLLWLVLIPHELPLLQLAVLYYLLYAGIEYMQWLFVLYYSDEKWQDARLWWIPPLVPLYQMVQRCVTSVAVIEEVFGRRSFRDAFVPEHVRRATWHW